MASLSYQEKKKLWRVDYTIRLSGRTRRRTKYARTQDEGRFLQSSLLALESGVKSGVARSDDIKSWIQREYLKLEEAGEAFPGYLDSIDRDVRAVLTGTDYGAILSAYEDYALRTSKAKDPGRKTHLNHMSVAREVIRWMAETAPHVINLREAQCRDYLRELETTLAPWTVFHRLTKLRLLLDQAVELGMATHNPARVLKLRQPKTVVPRRVLNPEEASMLLATSLRYRQWIYGGLPTVVRLGLYAGLRDEEMRWAQWTWLDAGRGILTVQRSVCTVTGETWEPKDNELRRLDVKEALVSYLDEERSRQEEAGVLGRYLLRGRSRGKPISSEGPGQAFRRMVAAEELDPSITIYSLRHTYATELLRISDIRTVQRRLGHASIRTTEQYLHEIEPEAHPTKNLPW